MSEIARSEQDMLDNLLYQASILAQGGQDWQKTLKCLKRLWSCLAVIAKDPDSSVALTKPSLWH